MSQQRDLANPSVNHDDSAPTPSLRARISEVPRYQVYAIQAVLALVAIGVTLPFNPLTEGGTRNTALSALMEAVSFVGLAPWNVIIIAVIGLVIGLQMSWWTSGYLIAATAVQGIVSTLIKIVYPTQRPNDTDVNALIPAINNAFPSGHVMLYVVYCGFLFFLAWSEMRHTIWRTLTLILTSVLIVLGAPARVYLGTHWHIDVIGAQLIGFVLLVIGIEVWVRRVAPRQEAN